MIKSALQSSLTNDIKYTSMSVGNLPSNEYLIQSYVLDSVTATVTFDITGLGSQFRHLQLVIAAKTNRADRADLLYIKLNNSDATKAHILQGTGTSVQSLSEDLRVGYIAGATTTSVFGAAVVDILDAFSSTKNKTVRVLSGYNNGTGGGESIVALGSNFLNSTSTLTSVVVAAIGSFAIGSRFSLYGVTA
jgi:hypothetical protein